MTRSEPNINTQLSAVVLAQLEERSLPTPEIRGLNPVIGKLFTIKCIEKTKIKKKGPGMAHSKNTCLTIGSIKNQEVMTHFLKGKISIMGPCVEIRITLCLSNIVPRTRSR